MISVEDRAIKIPDYRWDCPQCGIGDCVAEPLVTSQVGLEIQHFIPIRCKGLCALEAEKKEVVVRVKVSKEEHDAVLARGKELLVAIKEAVAERGITYAQAAEEIGFPGRQTIYKLGQNYNPASLAKAEAWLGSDLWDDCDKEPNLEEVAAAMEGEFEKGEPDEEAFKPLCLSNWVREAAKDRGLTITQAIDQIGISRATFYGLDKENCPTPGYETLTRVKEWLGADDPGICECGFCHDCNAAAAEASHGEPEHEKTIRDLIEANRLVEAELAKREEENQSLRASLEERDARIGQMASDLESIRAREKSFEVRFHDTLRELQEVKNATPQITYATDYDRHPIGQLLQKLREKQQAELYEEPASFEDLREQLSEANSRNAALEAQADTQSRALRSLKSKLYSVSQIIEAFGDDARVAEECGV